MEKTVKSGGPLRVFLAEDHASYRAGLRLLLSGIPSIEVVGEASTGTEAEQGIRELRPHVALLDLGLPDRSGISVASSLKQDGVDVRLLVLSGSYDDETVGRLVGAGVDGYVLKSEPASEILRALEAAAAGDSYFSPKAGSRLFEMARSVSLGSVPLSRRESEVARLVSQGLSNKEIAGVLGRSDQTVKAQKASLMRKIGARSSKEIRDWFRRHGKKRS